MNAKSAAALLFALIACVPAAQANDDQDFRPGPEVQLIPAPAHIAADVDRSAELFSEAAVMAPAVLATAVKAFNRHGVKFFFYDDRETKQATNQLGQKLGGAFAHFAQAISKDMVKVAQTSLARR
jgi:hypothetical protein